MTTDSQRESFDNQNDEISLKELVLKIRDWWRYLLSKWMIIFIFGLLGGALGFTYAYFKKPIYTATTTFVLEDEKGGGLGNLAGLASMAGVDIGGGGGIFQGENILSLYRSRTMIEKTLLTIFENDGKTELLVDRYIKFNQLRKTWKDKPELNNLSFPIGTSKHENTLLPVNRLRDSIMGVIVTDLNNNYLTVAKPDKKLSTIQIDVKAIDEIFAKAFNDALVTNVNQFYINTKTKKTLINVQILQHKTDSVRAVMNGDIYKAVEVTDATPNLNPTRQVQRIAPAQKAQFSAETNKAVLGSLVQNLELSKMTLMKEAPLLEIVDRPIYPLKKDKIGKLKGITIGCFLVGIIGVISLMLGKTYRRIVQN